ncbi:MAG TPA: alpha-ketoglutarate-dependent dioxygenase AlkB [Puia sp.]|jgi:alkylated DNA repair dioxygenase AlkB|nr:alpha-ketoglutarate-dependent dioxygenase AlkB [Puia sp.]
MDLFNSETVFNLLPYDGVADYYGKVFTLKEAQHYFDRLLTMIEWRNDEIIMFGKRIQTKRKVAWYGDDTYSYTYSKMTKEALVWTDDLRALKQKAEDVSGASYNSCLLNLYHDGDEGVSWHSDDEKELEKEGAIASFSFGAERKFQFKHKGTGQLVETLLESGSLLVMRGTCQEHWLHALPKTKKVRQPRVNLTFRTIVG